MTFAEILRKRRKELDFTLLEIANKIGVSEATVQRWESGNIKSLRQGRISQLANILDVTPAYLMGWEETPQTETNKKEQRLIDNFKAMNIDGQDKLLSYSDDLIMSGKYQKSSSIQKNA